MTAKAIEAFAVAHGDKIDIFRIDTDRESLIKTLNRPAGERVIPVKIMELKK